MEKSLNPIKRLKPTQIIVLSFLIIILVGAFFLSLPISSASGTHTPFIDALFTATSATCVTGLVVVSTVSHWSLFGQFVIFILIQIGGLGIMTIVTATFMVFGKKITLKERVIIQESFNLFQNNGLVAFVKYIVTMTLIIEAIGAIFLAFKFIPEYGFLDGLFKSVFHSVSAFCNAGFDIIGETSLMKYHDDVYINFIIMKLIVLGGLGFTVCHELIDMFVDVFKKKYELKMGIKRLSLHTKLVLTITSILIVFGFVAFFVLEYNNPKTIAGMGIGDKMLASLFQSVTLRTAGFATIDEGGLTYASKFLSVIFMMIGGSPSGTAGGIKTVTMGVVIIAVISVIKGNDSIDVYGRSISLYNLQKALSVFMLLLSFLIVGSIVLACTEMNMLRQFEFLDLLFETASALGTVGVSTGITPFLSQHAKVVITVFMFIGRLGPVTIAVAVASRRKSTTNLLHYPEGKILVG